MQTSKPLLFLSIMIILGSFTYAVGDNWAYPEWNYRKPIDLTNPGSELTGHQIKVMIDYDQAMNADYSDIRFATDESMTELDFWIEYMDEQSATIWVKIDSIPSGTSKIFVYYGNPSPSSTPESTISDPEEIQETKSLILKGGLVEYACLDKDNDNYSIGVGLCGLVDCDDKDPEQYPGTRKVTDTNKPWEDTGTCRIEISECNGLTGTYIIKQHKIGPRKEICDKRDNDCDGEIDNNGACDTIEEAPEENDIQEKRVDMITGTTVAIPEDGYDPGTPISLIVIIVIIGIFSVFFIIKKKK